MRSFLFAVLMLASASAALAQSSPAQVDQNAILRLGDLVQHVGDGIEGASDAFVEAMAPPASDADKWFISVISTRGCAACEVLKREWTTNEWLLALANPNDPKQSWAHYNVYDWRDQSQQFRFQNVRVSSFPTILVQPPRTGKYGDPSTIVFQGTFEGGPEKLARAITAAIRQYVAKFQAATPSSTQGFGADPPWSPTPRVDPWQPTPQPSPFDPTIPPVAPQATPLLTASWVTVVWPLVAPAVVAGIGWLAYSIRAQRLAQGKQPLVDQATLDQMLALLKKLAEHPPQAPKA